MMAPHMLSLAGPSFQATWGVSAAPEGTQCCSQLYSNMPLACHWDASTGVRRVLWLGPGP